VMCSTFHRPVFSVLRNQAEEIAGPESLSSNNGMIQIRDQQVLHVELGGPSIATMHGDGKSGRPPAASLMSPRALLSGHYSRN